MWLMQCRESLSSEWEVSSWKPAWSRWGQMTMSMINLMARMLERCWRRRKVVTRPVARRQNATNPENISSPSILYLVIWNYFKTLPLSRNLKIPDWHCLLPSKRFLPASRLWWHVHSLYTYGLHFVCRLFAWRQIQKGRQTPWGVFHSAGLGSLYSQHTASILEEYKQRRRRGGGEEGERVENRGWRRRLVISLRRGRRRWKKDLKISLGCYYFLKLVPWT